MCDVLYLNADYSPMSVLPLSTLSWRDAIKLVYLGQVQCLDMYKDWFVHSPSVSLQVPSIVVNKKYVKTSRGVRFSKYTLCLRDDYTCQYCAQRFEFKKLTMEHVLPKSKGGKTNYLNIVMSCQPCNTQKGNKTHIRPLKEPYKPTYGELVTKVKNQPVRIPHESWIPYIGWPPKLIEILSHGL